MDSDKDSRVRTDRSVGAPISETDLIMVREFAGSIKSLQKTKKSLTDYVDMRMTEIAPNLKDLAGSSLRCKVNSPCWRYRKTFKNAIRNSTSTWS